MPGMDRVDVLLFACAFLLIVIAFVMGALLSSRAVDALLSRPGAAVGRALVIQGQGR